MAEGKLSVYLFSSIAAVGVLAELACTWIDLDGQDVLDKFRKPSPFFYYDGDEFRTCHVDPSCRLTLAFPSIERIDSDRLIS
jgi:hypothetical protein